MEHFKELQLPEALNHTLTNMNFSKPTPIQCQAIPHALLGKDILGSAPTGTGKTGAFGIPLVAELMSNQQSAALIMTPTRELAAQVMIQLQKMLGKQSKIKTALMIGGEQIEKQLRQLKNHPRLFVGTPGRISDHLDRGSLKLNNVNLLVLDETDRMLDMGFTIQIERIIKHLPKQRQTLLFSATLPREIVKISKKYLNDPIRVAVDNTPSAVENMKQEVIHLSDSEKYTQLLTQLDQRQGSIILFMKTKYATQKMAIKLVKQGHSADAIHGDLRQNKRDRVINNFRKQKYRILVATDVASRGLDIPHIEHVINYDLPQCPEDYTHRIGRTARAGAQGSALCLITPADQQKWHAINHLLNPDAKPANAQRYKSKKKQNKPFKNNKKRNNKKNKNFGKSSVRSQRSKLAG
ncbi:MAG: DEAD/DEAH box helicase [Rickettsiaceae bacterium]|nr:DEAD/DEAH box helicase [Rickettsiaceae bacterium]